MWLTSSSIGRKFVMAVTGICLILFLTFHCLMNAVAILWPASYNVICEFLGANWYALVASVGLAALFIIHILYACWLTLQNRKARGNDRYAVTSRPAQVEWSSKNMLVLGIVVVAFLVVHLVQFWSKMQLQEILSSNPADWAKVDGAVAAPAFGTLFLQSAFSLWYITPVIYLIGFVALWFHMNHGFWSMFHTIGWDNNIWIKRLKTISAWWTSIIVGLFVIQLATFTWMASKDYYLTAPELQAQYGEYWAEQADETVAAINDDIQAVAIENGMMGQPRDQYEAQRFQGIVDGVLEGYLPRVEAIVNAVEKTCPTYQSQTINMLKGLVERMHQQAAAAEEAPAQNENVTEEKH